MKKEERCLIGCGYIFAFLSLIHFHFSMHARQFDGKKGQKNSPTTLYHMQIHASNISSHNAREKTTEREAKSSNATVSIECNFIQMEKPRENLQILHVLICIFIFIDVPNAERSQHAFIIRVSHVHNRALNWIVSTTMTIHFLLGSNTRKLRIYRTQNLFTEKPIDNGTSWQKWT